MRVRVDDLAECLAISELEMRRSRTVANRLQAFADFETTVGRIDALRREAESLRAMETEVSLDDLDRKVADVMRSSPYRITRWLATDGARLSWLVGREAAYPN
jgi:hypothetical protein